MGCFVSCIGMDTAWYTLNQFKCSLWIDIVLVKSSSVKHRSVRGRPIQYVYHTNIPHKLVTTLYCTYVYTPTQMHPESYSTHLCV